MGGDVWCGGHGGFGVGFGVGLGGHGFVGGFGFGLGGGHGLVGCVGVGFTTGGTTTGGTTTGGTVTVTGGTVTVTGGITTGGTVTVTGGTVTGSGTSIVTVTGFDRLGGFVEPVPGGWDCGAPVAEVEPGVGVTAGVVGGVTAGEAGLADGVGVLVAPGVGVAECGLGTTISGLPPPEGSVEPKYEPATGWCDPGDTTAWDPTTITLTVAAVAMPTKEAAATKVLVEVAASAEGRCNPAPSFTAVAPPWWALRRGP